MSFYSNKKLNRISCRKVCKIPFAQNSSLFRKSGGEKKKKAITKRYVFQANTISHLDIFLFQLNYIPTIIPSSIVEWNKLSKGSNKFWKY